MKNISFRNKMLMSLAVFIIALLTFLFITFIMLKAPIQLDAVFNHVVLSLALALYAFFVFQYGSAIALIGYILAFVAAFWSLSFSVAKSGVSAASFNGLFIWIIVAISINVISVILDLMWKSRRKRIRKEHLAKEQAEQERLLTIQREAEIAEAARREALEEQRASFMDADDSEN